MENEVLNPNCVWGSAKDIIPSIYYQAVGMGRFIYDDEALLYRFNPTKMVGEEEVEAAKSVITITPAQSNFENNKYGKVKFGTAVSVTIAPSTDLKVLYPDAIVVIDGKEHTIGVLDKAISLTMDKDHRISIDWKHGEVVETFRIITDL